MRSSWLFGPDGGGGPGAQEHFPEVFGVVPRERVQARLDAASRRGLDQHDRQPERPAQQRRLEREVLDPIERDPPLLAVQEAFADAQLLEREGVLERQVADDRSAQLQQERGDEDDRRHGGLLLADRHEGEQGHDHEPHRGERQPHVEPREAAGGVPEHDEEAGVEGERREDERAPRPLDRLG